MVCTQWYILCADSCKYHYVYSFGTQTASIIHSIFRGISETHGTKESKQGQFQENIYILIIYAYLAQIYFLAHSSLSLDRTSQYFLT